MNDNHLQFLIDGMSAHEQRGRAATQMTLGKMIAQLETMAPMSRVSALGGAHSYRGFYDDIAFSLSEGTRLASDVLAECRAAMGQVFVGYKGGDYVMGALTPVWVAEYGYCGKRLMGFSGDGNAIIESVEP